MRLSTASRYKFLKDYRIGIPEVLSEASYNGNISILNSDVSDQLNWIPKAIFNQIGQTINGEADGDRFGGSVSMNALGDIVAVGALLNDGNGNASGHARVYQLSTYNGINTWAQLGQDIDGALSVDYFGTSVSLNAIGNRVAIGAPNNDGNGNLSGHVRIYELSSYNSINTWVQLGQDINGTITLAREGRSVALNETGNIVAMGGTGRNASNIDTGHVRVFQLSSYNGTNTWVQLGQDLNGISVTDWFGYSLDLNSAGNTLVVGATLVDDPPGSIGSNQGSTTVYKLSANNGINTWVQVGQAIIGEGFYDGSGTSVSINSTGDRIFIGADSNDGNGSDSGHVRAYQLSSYNETDIWVQLGEDIDGSIVNNKSGFSVSTNSVGNIVAIGSQRNTDTGQRTRVFQLSSINGVESWVKIGTIPNEEYVQYELGLNVSLNSAGDKLAIGAPGETANGTLKIIDLTPINLDDPYTSFNDETVSVTRPAWKYANNLNISGGWYNSLTNEFITDTSQLNLTGSPDKLTTSQKELKGFNWVEVAAKKNTNTTLSTTAPSSIYFKLTGFTPGLIKPPVISFTFNTKTTTLTGNHPFFDVHNNIFSNVIPNYITLSSSNEEDVFINYTSDVQPLTSYYRWELGSSVYTTKNITPTGIVGTPTITNYISSFAYKNTYPTTTNSFTLYTANSSFFNFATKSTYTLGSKLSTLPREPSAMNFFTVKNPATNTFTRNNNMWAADMVDQLNALVVYKGAPTFSTYSYGGTLITPRHVLYARHAFPTRDQVRFVTSDNKVVSAVPLSSVNALTYASNSNISQSWAYEPEVYDLGIMLLDRDVSLSGINPIPLAAISPTERAILASQFIPTIVPSQAPGRTTSEINPNPLSGSDIQLTIQSTNFKQFSYAWGNDSNENPFYNWCTQDGGYTIWDGDSGNPHLLYNNNKLYLYSITKYIDGSGAITASVSGAIDFLISKVDELARVNTGMRPTYYTLDEIANR